MPPLKVIINYSTSLFGLCKNVNLTFKHGDDFMIHVVNIRKINHNIWNNFIKNTTPKMLLGLSKECDTKVYLFNDGVSIKFDTVSSCGNIHMVYSIPYSDCEEAFKGIFLYLEEINKKK